MRRSPSPSRSHALVIGGGIAGLVTSHVLLRHCKRVTLVERDIYPAEPVFRSGVPQGQQVHTLLLRGQHVLEELFPGLTQKLLAAGAIGREYGSGSLYVSPYGPLCQIPPRLHGWNCSRLFLEWHLLQEVRHSDRITVVEGAEVVRLLGEKQQGQIDGVRYLKRGQAAPQEVHADLIIDASGALSQAPIWLEQLGYQAPQETVVAIHQWYATRWYASPVPDAIPWNGVIVRASPPLRRDGVLMEVEGGRWMVILSGRGEDALPTDEAAFLSFAQSLSDPTIARAIQAGQPCSPMDSYCRTHIQWRHFERLSSGPQNFLVLGDAACVLNPVYGQGMTIAILEAVLLDRCLRQQDHGALACVFQRQQAHLLRRPWQYAERAERLLAGNNTETNWGSRIVRQYIETLMHLVTIDPRASLIFQEYLHMLRSSRSFLHPYLVKQVLRLWVKKWRHGREQRASAQE
ncbi:2-polyprenyl-6-methoxyphenol hydroxylase-like FAD-dependent oxidoreductase [Thermosporothrix hazakensis]|uniref:2-polyprenyl-6-methoxyphenol hydroxylase-like FAD-dependent oxidoreductase n=1 Tax=Thermosporothrix hazakensis TaxID=644383 RepID=A0A326TVE0_THEHA|nr:FAD-dependent monooxygenase [Thermosporothrix hazakensis]PZW20736.1 2-polyprenyl-6-methoxyphenol hydroxylase-like FAD-dependent oxidoreductase [Thermosporothrix hazakensis]GCE49864.1 hypothetical protein KTH_47330 [Thermosporothrix hazakensis]